MGWSRGGVLAYAYANRETTVPEQDRQVNALIPFDIAFKLNPEHEEQRNAACIRYAGARQQLANGQYVSPLGSGVRAFGLLAATSPDTASPVDGFTNFTNKQVALLVGAATHILFQPYPPVPFYHLNAGTFDQNGLPSGLQFTKEAYLYDFYQTAAPYQSSTEQAETDGLICNEEDLPYDDRLSEINVPVLYVGAGGGFGEFGLDTLDTWAAPIRVPSSSTSTARRPAPSSSATPTSTSRTTPKNLSGHPSTTGSPVTKIIRTRRHGGRGERLVSSPRPPS